MNISLKKLEQWLEEELLVFISGSTDGEDHYDLVIDKGEIVIITHVVMDAKTKKVIFIGGITDFNSENEVVYVDVELLTKEEFWEVYCEKTE